MTPLARAEKKRQDKLAGISPRSPASTAAPRKPGAGNFLAGDSLLEDQA